MFKDLGLLSEIHAKVHQIRLMKHAKNTKPRLKAQILPKKAEAGDPRYRLPQSQLDSPCEGGQVRAGV